MAMLNNQRDPEANLCGFENYLCINIIDVLDTTYPLVIEHNS